MDRISSIDDILGTYWNPSSMNRSASELAFPEFLTESIGGNSGVKSRLQTQSDELGRGVEKQNGGELPVAKPGDREFIPPIFASTEELRTMNDVVASVGEDGDAVQLEGALGPNLQYSDMQGGGGNNYMNFASGAAAAGDVSSSSQVYEDYLKQKLEFTCAAASLQANDAGANTGLSSAASPQTNLEIESSAANAFPRKLGQCASSGIPPLAPRHEVDASGKLRPITSGSELSDDEDHGLLDKDLPPRELKRVKRMLSNRESARRSRRRKQAHLSDLEVEVEQLRNENTTLTQRLQGVINMHKEASIDKRILMADVEALRAKVKMAESMMVRQGQPGMTEFLPDTSLSFMERPYMNDMERPFSQQTRHSSMLRHDLQQPSGGHTPSLQRATSLERQQKRIRNGSICNSPAGWGPMDRPAMVQEHGH